MDENEVEIKLELDHYQVLGLPPNASAADIRKAHKSLSQKYHPDKRPDSEEHYMRIRKAYATLKDPQRKAIYDQGIKQGINPEEFRIVLRAVVLKVSTSTIDLLASRSTPNISNIVRECIAKEKATLAGNLKELKNAIKQINTFLLTVKEGRDSLVIQGIDKKIRELQGAVTTCDVGIAVMNYLLEDSKRIHCVTEDPFSRMITFGELAASKTFYSSST